MKTIAFHEVKFNKDQVRELLITSARQRLVQEKANHINEQLSPIVTIELNGGATILIAQEDSIVNERQS